MNIETAFQITQPLNSLGRNNDAPDHGDAPEIDLGDIAEFIGDEERKLDGWCYITEALSDFGTPADCDNRLGSILEAFEKGDDAELGRIVSRAIVDYVTPFVVERKAE